MVEMTKDIRKTFPTVWAGKREYPLTIAGPFSSHCEATQEGVEPGQVPKVV
jgi:hypothetical protein